MVKPVPFRQEDLDRPAQQLAAGISENLLGLGVDHFDGAAGVDHDDCVRCRFDDKPEPRFADLEGSLGRLEGGDVASNEKVLLFGFGPHTGPPQGHDPAILVHVPALEVARLPAVARRAHLVSRAVEILRVQELCGAVPDHLVGVVPQDENRARADPNEGTPAIDNQDQIQRRFEDPLVDRVHRLLPGIAGRAGGGLRRSGPGAPAGRGIIVAGARRGIGHARMFHQPFTCAVAGSDARSSRPRGPLVTKFRSVAARQTQDIMTCCRTASIGGSLQATLTCLKLLCATILNLVQPT
jgi:hypothetical protein